jgi:hypothetical protein
MKPRIKQGNNSIVLITIYSEKSEIWSDKKEQRKNFAK